MEIVARNIGSVAVASPIVLAPMAGITDVAFRLIATSLGASLAYIPLISAKALCLQSPRTFEMLVSDPAERPVAVQIYGDDPDTISRAVELLEPYPLDLVDINMACPVPKVVGHGGGASLLRHPTLAGNIVAAAVKATRRPVTVKLRSGWDETSVNFLEIGVRAQDAGASAVALHPRHRAQGFAGKADWKQIAAAKQRLSIPVIGSGDVDSPEAAKRMLDETGCDLVMIARAARGNPWIFERTSRLLQCGVAPPEPTAAQRLHILALHCTILARFEQNVRAALKMRKHAGWYIKGLKNAAAARERINHAHTLEEIIAISRELQP